MFRCSSCNTTFIRLAGRCTACGEWNTMIEDNNIGNRKVTSKSQEKQKILINSIKEFEKVLKLYTKSVVLIGGEPGIGKSTLMCQLACSLNGKGIYLCGEEYSEIVSNRFDRVSNAKSDNVKIIDFIFLDNLENLIKDYKPDFIILDSIHTTRSESNDNAKDIVLEIIDLSRQYNFCGILISHITKEGIIAGPKTLEHMVDAVLYMEGDRYGSCRFLRSIKNRFGPTGATGLFEMECNGLREISNPSEMFLAHRKKSIPGSTIFPFYAGVRTYLIEIQALVVESSFFNVEAIGVDVKRVNMIVAILKRWCKLNYYKYNIYINVIGAMKITDPAADLAIAAALISALKQQEIDSTVCFFGELSLTGEVRPTQGEKTRVSEAERMGFEKIYSNSENIKDKILDVQQLLKIIVNVN